MEVSTGLYLWPVGRYVNSHALSVDLASHFEISACGAATVEPGSAIDVEFHDDFCHFKVRFSFIMVM